MIMANSVRNRLKLKANNDTTSSSMSSTPMKMLSNIEKDYSPVFVPCTQESLDNVDVLWDWNSPHAKSRPTRRPKRIINAQKSSPKLPIKKFNGHVASNSFDKIRDELKALQDEIEIPQSPRFEFDDDELALNNNKPNELDNFFDDSLEQELVMVSQQVEEKLKDTETKINVNMTTPKELKIAKASPRTLTKSFSSNTLLDSPVRTPHRNNFDFKGKLQQLRTNDSFDIALQALGEEVGVGSDSFRFSTRIKREHNQHMYDSAAGSARVNDFVHLNVNVKQEMVSPSDALRFKTKSLSFGDSYVKKSNDDDLMEEIERKRQAALAKLRARKPIPSVLSDSDTSPIKCSPEEIELKRQQALAKLEQKKKQEMIERNRQEALKRLEMNRRKRAQ